MRKSLFFLLLTLFFFSGKSIAQQLPEIQWGNKKNAFTTVAPPSIFTYNESLGKTTTATFQIHYNDPAPPLEAQWAIEYAVNIQEYLINTTVSQTINIDVKWEDLGSDISSLPLAQCGPTSYYNSSSLPDPDTQYPIALAEYLLNQNLNGNAYEMTIKVNSDTAVDWPFNIREI